MPDYDSDRQKIHQIIHSMIQPLIPFDPSGVEIRVSNKAVTIIASSQNRKFLLGKAGAMVKALRQLVAPFGWTLQIPTVVNEQPFTPPPFTPPIHPVPDPRDLAMGWLESRYGPEAYRMTGEPDDNEWNVVVHPDYFNQSDMEAIDTWIWAAARAQGQRLKVRLMPGGVIRG